MTFSRFRLRNVPLLSRVGADRADTLRTDVDAAVAGWPEALLLRVDRRNQVLISDGTGTLSLVFFNQPFLTEEKYPNALVPGRRGLFSGKVKLYKGMRQLAHPQHQMFTEEGQEPPDPEVDPEGAKAWEETPLPIYPATAALTSWKIEKAVELALAVLITFVVVPWGLFTRTQRDLLRTTRERADRAEAEQRAHVEAAREAERRRIASEMHDVLAHRLSLLAVHAGVTGEPV